MAGIGFELKKLFGKKGVLQGIKAYGYTTIICAGPMLFGILMLLGIMGLCTFAGVETKTREYLICTITYTLFASVMLSSFFSMIVTRYVSDMLFEEKYEAALPAFWGSNILMLIAGDLLYGIFLLFSGATLTHQLLCFVLFSELILVWNSMNFLTAIKDYKGILCSFLASVLVAVGSGMLLIFLGLPVVEAILVAVCLGYGVMLLWNVILLHRYFPASEGRAFSFLQWFDAYLPLALSGLFVIIGMYAHIVIMWFSDIGEQCRGLFFSAPHYDLPALLAYLTTLVTTVNFVVSVEVNFYPKYKIHYSLYNDKGMIRDIKQSEKDMLRTLRTEIFYTALKQLLFTAACIALGGYLFDLLPLGFNEIMRGYFRTLCVAYGLYAVGNMLMLILMYFTDYKGAVLGTAVFAASTIVFTLLSLLLPSVYYGFGFLLAGVLFVLVCAVRLNNYTARLPYYILSVQPLVAHEKNGPFTKLGVALDKGFAKMEEHSKKAKNENPKGEKS